MIFLYLIFYILYLIYNKIWQSNLIKIKIQHHLLKKRLSKIIQKMALNLIFILSLENYSTIQKMNLRVNLYILYLFSTIYPYVFYLDILKIARIP